MKKIFVCLLLLMTVASSISFAKINDLPDPGVEEVFKEEFAGAENVSWSQQENYQKATFILAGHRMIAYFNEDHELAGCIRDIFYDQLPLIVMKAIDKKFPKAEFQEVGEIINNDGTSYLLWANWNNKKYKIKISSDGNISEIEKLKK